MSINEYLDFKARTYEGDPGGLRVIGGNPESNSRVGIIVLIILIILLAIAGAIALYFLVLRRGSSTSTTGTDGAGGGGGGGGGGGVTGCTSNDACSGIQVCNLSTGQCVNCFSNAQCSGSTPNCDTSTGTCKECVTSGDCGSGTCLGGICCDSAPPVITGVTTSLAQDSSFTVQYTYAQDNIASAQVEVSLQTNAGVPLATAIATANGNNQFLESSLNIPNDHLFPGTAYQVQIRILYTCQSASTTTFSAPFGFTMPACGATGLPSNNGVFNANGNPAYGGGPVAIAHLAYNFSFPVGVLISPTSGFHPNLATIYYPLIITETYTTPPDFFGDTFTYAYTKFGYPGPVGSTNYIRYYGIGAGNNCNSNLSAQLTFTRTF